MKRYCLILNPNAGNLKARKLKPKIISLLQSQNIEFDLYETQGHNHAIELAEKAVTKAYTKFIVAGGDGTLNEVVNGIMNSEENIKDIILGMIPIGTGNDWCKTFKIPKSFEDAVKLITSNNHVKQDIAKISYYDDSIEKQKYIANIAGFGFDAEVANQTNIDKEQGKGSKIIYLKNIFSILNKFQSVETTLTFDDKTIQSPIFSLSAGKGIYNGGGMKQLPNAIFNDGFLDFTVIKNVTKFEVLTNVPKLFSGTHIKHKKIDTYKTKSLKIASIIPMKIEIDGEFIGYTPATIEVIPKALNVISGLRSL